MEIQTQQSFSGFVASEPRLTYTENGDARLFMKVGKEYYRQEHDGSFTELETTFHNLVAFKAAAEQGHARFAKGDRFVAEGYVREYSCERDGQTIEGEEFTARRLGHDMARTRYEVDRAPRRQGVGRAAAWEASAFEPPAHSQPTTSSPAIGM
ncbi:single-stranded DNA-binding protein [Homoserinimonas sp. OAct 916]|uniref:single-stranded DNA-binding protein n=1 Tax=Homoserinimonas sp. OAct 916 TaxID=2211450 RepID=UPI000DBEAA50|nr:single-stranded DNA-binding protein [Homoserinimonas sp. OAct 916]